MGRCSAKGMPRAYTPKQACKRERGGDLRGSPNCRTAIELVPGCTHCTRGNICSGSCGFSRAEFDLLTWQQARGKWGIRQVTEDVGAIAEGKGVICVFFCVICVFLCYLCLFYAFRFHVPRNGFLYLSFCVICVLFWASSVPFFASFVSFLCSLFTESSAKGSLDSESNYHQF